MSASAELSQLLERVLEPLPGAAPTGPDLRDSTELNAFSRLQGVIKEDRRYQDKAGHEGTPANWNDVGQRALDILTTESKDLEVAVWLARALVKTRGLDGLREGLAAIRGLQSRFGDALHPGDPELRKSRLAWLDQQLEMDLRALPLPDPTQREQLAAWARILREEIADLTTTVEQWKTYYREDAPDLSHSRRALDFLDGAVKAFGVELLADAPASATGSAPAPAGSALAASGGPHSRAEALQLLERVAAYFETNEPLSPVPHLLRRAARWARGSLQQWLDEMVKEDQLDGIYKTLDMTKSAPPTEKQ